VAQHADISRTQAATLIANGNVLVNGRKERSSFRPVAGDVVMVEPPEIVTRQVFAESIPIAVVYEDEALLIVDKPAGMPAERAGIVHRLDKETSGLLIVAKTDRAHRILASALAARRVHRSYAVMISGHLAGDTLSIEKPVARDPRDRKRMAIVSNGRQAKTDFVRLARFGPGDLLRAHLHTGRTHQIRVHLASVGHPVMGDDTYGGGGGRRIAGLPPRRHFLHAAWLVFTHPITGAPMDIRSPLPEDLKHSLSAIAEGSGLPEAEDPLVALGFYD